MQSMAVAEPPKIPAVVGGKALKRVDQATPEDVGAVVEVLDATVRACQQTPRPAPAITVEEIGKLAIYEHLLERDYADRHYPKRNDNAAQSRLDEVLKAVEQLTTQVSNLQTAVDKLSALPEQVSNLQTAVDKLSTLPDQVAALQELPQTVEALSTNFGTFAIPIVQRHNAGCVGGTNFQRVPFPNGKWPEPSNELESLESIGALTVERLKAWCRSYGLRLGGSKTELARRLVEHLGAAQVAERLQRE